jgi:hypothetical protein
MFGHPIFHNPLIVIPHFHFSPNYEKNGWQCVVYLLFLLLMMLFFHMQKWAQRNPSLGLVTKARVYKVAGWKEAHEWRKSVKEWTLTLPRELPIWEFGLSVNSQIFRRRL